MPRTLDPMLSMALERANPNVCHFVEINAPDVERVLRRAPDQFLTSPPLVSQSPANSITADPTGTLTIASAASTLADFTVLDAAIDLPREDLAHNVRGLAWKVDKKFGRAVLRTFSAVLRRNLNSINNMALQIYRLHGEPVNVFAPGSSTPTPKIQRSWIPLLEAPALWVFSEADAIATNRYRATFDLTKLHLEVGTSNLPAPSIEQVGEENVYYFVITPQDITLDTQWSWWRDRTSARTITDVGTFEDRWWNRGPKPDDGWILAGPISVPAGVPAATLALEAFAPTAQAIYALTLPAAPQATSVGRVVFDRGIPTGTAATLELSTAGSGGPWIVVKHGDIVAAHQAAYHARVTLTPNAALRVAPRVAAIGVEFKIPYDATAEASVEPISQEIAVPFLKASIGEGRVSVVRFGRRDYRDLASELASQYPTSKLEVDVFLGSRHPLVTRDKWLHVDRALVNNRDPSATAEEFGLLSFLKSLKRKIPPSAEGINAVLTVSSATTSSVTVTSDLPGTSEGPYLGKNYYMRVRSSSQAGVESGLVATIDNSTGSPARTLTFVPPLLGTLVAGDVIEVHSSSYVQAGLRWENADPADIWWELHTVHLLVAEDRLGRGDLGRASRSGLPPKVTDRAPGDAATQKLLLVTLQTTGAESGDELIDQLSFIMGGATVDIGGQICFRQIYAIRDATGQIVVPPEPVAATFDVRNMAGLSTPTGLEQRIAQLACDWGVNTTAAGKDAQPAQTSVAVDVDALAWADDQPFDELAPASIPKEIARWCYNSTDGGSYLASLLAQQVVRAASTGLRVWSWTATEAQPQLVVGDRVAVVTDAYTDYDPARKVAIRGWWAYTLCVVAVQGAGTQFRGYMLGLSDAIQLRGGPGDLAVDTDTEKTEILSVDFKDSPDGTTRTYDVIAGTGIALLHVHHRLWPNGAQGSPFDFGELQDVTDDPQLLIVRPDPADGHFRFTLAHPSRAYQRFILLVPRQGPPTFPVVGDVWKIVLDPAPPAVSAKLHAAVVNAAADFSADITAGVSDWPVRVDIMEGAPDASPLVSVTLVGPATIDKISNPILGARPLPLRELEYWWVLITNVNGEEFWFGPESANRDPLPQGTVTADTYRSAPVFRMVFDTDTDTIRVTLPDGRTKTFSGITLVSSPAIYTVGDVLDDLSTENALAVDESRTPYKVEYQGGGQWVTMFGPAGVLHGAPSNPPTAKMRVVKSANRDAEDLYITPDSSAVEKITVYYRDGELVTSPTYRLCVSAGDPTPLFVVAGTEIGPSHFFRNVDGTGSPSAKLSGIALTRDQVKRVTVGVEGQDSHVQAWLPWTLSLMEKPWNESFEVVWDNALGKLRGIVLGGANCLFETMQFADNDAFTSPTTLTGSITDGGTLILELALSAAQRGKTWYARVKPNNLAAGAGLDGEYQKASVAVPALFTVLPSFAETVSTGTLTLVVADPGGVLDPTWTTGAIVPAAATSAISFEVLRLGTRTIEAPTTKPGGGASTGTYTKGITLLDHPVTMNVFAHMIDGSTQFLGAWTFDLNKISDVVDITVANNDVTATVTVRWDTDTQVNSTAARYSTNGGGSWTDTPVNSSPLLLSQFNIGRSSTKTTVLIEAKNVVDGNYGTRSTVEIDAYVTEIGQGTVSIDSNGTWSFSADGGSNVASWKYSTSTSSFPADATVASSGTGASGRAISIVNGGTLSFGQTIFATLVPFTGASGTGTQLSAIHLRGSYLTYTATKTAAFAPGAWIVSQNALESTIKSASINNADGTLWNDALGSTDVTSMYMDFVIPAGCTITTILSEQYSGSAFAKNDMYCVRVETHAGTGIRNAFATSNLGWQALSTSLSETTANRSYHMYGQMYASGGSCAAGTIRMGNIYVTYTMPDPKQTY